MLESKSRGSLSELTSEFYTEIPHYFGMRRPPTISSREMLQQKFDLLNVLGDIEVATELMDKQKQSHEAVHPIDGKNKEMH